MARNPFLVNSTPTDTSGGTTRPAGAFAYETWRGSPGKIVSGADGYFAENSNPRIGLTPKVPFRVMPSMTSCSGDGKPTVALSTISDAIGSGILRPDGSPIIGKVTRNGKTWIRSTVKSTDRETAGSTSNGTITGISWAGGVATVQLNTGASWPSHTVGQIVTLNDQVPSAYAGVYAIASVDSVNKRFTYALASDPGGSASTMGTYTATGAANGSNIVSGAKRARMQGASRNMRSGQVIYLAWQWYLPGPGDPLGSVKDMKTGEKRVSHQGHDRALGGGLGPGWAIRFEGGATPAQCKRVLQLGTAVNGTPGSLSGYTTVDAWTETDYPTDVEEACVLRLETNWIAGNAQFWIEGVAKHPPGGWTYPIGFNDTGVSGDTHDQYIDDYDYNYISHLVQPWARTIDRRNVFYANEADYPAGTLSEPVMREAAQQPDVVA